MPTRLKVVILLQEGATIIGLQGEDTDPAMQVMPACPLEEALGAVPEILARARDKWATSPKKPAYVGPQPPPAPAPTGRTNLATPATRSATSQQRFF